MLVNVTYMFIRDYLKMWRTFNALYMNFLASIFVNRQRDNVIIKFCCISLDLVSLIMVNIK